MKKRLNYTLFIAAMFCIFTIGCKIDNYGPPNASFSGAIKDAVTKELVGTDIQSGSSMRALEIDPAFPSPTALTWVIKQNGEFRNDMVFAAKYDIQFIDCNFYPFSEKDVVLKPGTNVRDFEVTPYIRIKDFSITHDAANNRVRATFKIEGGKPEVKVMAMRLYAFTDIYVGEQVKFATSGNSNENNTYSRNLTGSAQTIDPAAVQTLTIDLAANQSLFALKRNYYFRIGALATGPTGVGAIRYNYSPTIVIPL